MATIITVASGKPGVGKSVVASNLGLLLSREGQRVVLVDLDTGGANLHILFGMFQPTLTLADFFSRKAKSLEYIAQTVGWGSGLRLIPGPGDPHASANPSFADQERLIRHLHQLDADIIIIDCAPGTSIQALDFFLLGDHQMVVANPDPTSVVESYRLLKLTAIRKVMNAMEMVSVDRDQSFGKEQEFESLESVIRASKEFDFRNSTKAEDLLRIFQPFFVLNRTTAQTKMSIAYLQKIVRKFIGSELVFLGEIPQNDAVEQSIRVFLPVVDLAPKSSAAKAFKHTTCVLLQRLNTHQSVLVS